MEFNEKHKKHWVLLGIFGFLLLGISRLNIIDLDLFHQISLFREFIRSGSFPYQDVFSYVETKNPVIHHEWGLGALIYIIIFIFNLDFSGLLIFRYLLYFAIFFTCYTFSKRNEINFFTFAPLLLVTMGLGFALPVLRAQVFTQFFLVLSIFIINSSNYYNNKYNIYVLVPIFLFWLNIHAGFLVGIGFVSFYILERFIKLFLENRSIIVSFHKLKHYFILLLFLSLIIFFNPYGYKYPFYLFEAITLDRSDIILEWKPIWNSSFYYLAIYLVNVTLIIYAIAFKGIKNLPDILFIIVLSWLTLLHYKYTTIYSIALLCYLPLYLKDTGFAKLLNNLPKSFPKLYFFIWIAFGIFSIIYSSNLKFWYLRMPTTLSENERDGVPIYPIGASNYLSSNKFVGNIITPFAAGSYISWKLFPSVKVSLDSRFEAAYSIEITKDNIRFYHGDEGWERFLTKYSTDAILIPLWSSLSKTIGDKIELFSNDKLLIYKKAYLDDGFSLYILESLNFPYVDKRGSVFYEKFH